ncbi:MAG: sigma-54 dependent transcriptional regulator [Ferruginibacter sp.]
MKRRILLIDDDPDLCTLLNRFLTRNGYEVEEAHSGNKGVEKFKQGNYDIVICDYKLGDMEGKDVLEIIKMEEPAAIVLIITGYTDIKTAVDVIKLGAYDYITKPLVPAEVLNVIKTITRAGENNDRKRTGGLLEENFVEGQSKASRELYRQVQIVAQTDYNVILYGETGTGKKVIGQTIHNNSKRKQSPFVIVDCGSLSKDLSGSEPTGNIKGTSANALTDKEGYFEKANGGTLFLDEVGNLSHDLQAFLLSVLQDRRFKRVGEKVEIGLDIRIIASSSENLQELCKNGRFREDLYHRLNQFSIDLPLLSKRKDDIPLFADFFLKKTKTELGKPIAGFEDDAMRFFINYTWPGNLRELKNVIRRAALLTSNHKITLNALPAEITQYEKKLLPGSFQKKTPELMIIKKDFYKGPADTSKTTAG